MRAQALRDCCCARLRRYDDKHREQQECGRDCPRHPRRLQFREQGVEADADRDTGKRGAHPPGESPFIGQYGPVFRKVSARESHLAPAVQDGFRAPPVHSAFANVRFGWKADFRCPPLLVAHRLNTVPRRLICRSSHRAIGPIEMTTAARPPKATSSVICPVRSSNFAFPTFSLSHVDDR